MIPSVVASESGRAQTRETCFSGVAGPRCDRPKDEHNVLEKTTRDRESRVCEVKRPSRGIPSNAVHVKLCMNPSRPLDKAKYSLATDSELVPRGKGEKNPGRGVK